MDEALAKALEGTTAHRDVSARQVSNGFALAGNTRYVNTGGQVVHAVTVEAVATTEEAAAESLRNFLTTGSFRP